MPLLSTVVGPWMLIEALLYLIAFVVFGKMTVIVLGVTRDVGNAVYEAATGPLRVLRDDPPGDGADDPDAEEEEEHYQRHEIRVAGVGARDPPPNGLWPPDDAFEEDNQYGNR